MFSEYSCSKTCQVDQAIHFCPSFSVSPTSLSHILLPYEIQSGSYKEKRDSGCF